jgi:hypothetical protein
LTSIAVFLWAPLSGEGWRSTGVKAFGVLEVAEPAIALGLPTGDDVVELALLGDIFVKRHAAVDHHG